MWLTENFLNLEIFQNLSCEAFHGFFLMINSSCKILKMIANSENILSLIGLVRLDPMKGQETRSDSLEASLTTQ